jgi:hypothetical protein
MEEQELWSDRPGDSPSVVMSPFASQKGKLKAAMLEDRLRGAQVIQEVLMEGRAGQRGKTELATPGSCLVALILTVAHGSQILVSDRTA